MIFVINKSIKKNLNLSSTSEKAEESSLTTTNTSMGLNIKIIFYNKN